MTKESALGDAWTARGCLTLACLLGLFLAGCGGPVEGSLAAADPGAAARSREMADFMKSRPKPASRKGTRKPSSHSTARLR